MKKTKKVIKRLPKIVIAMIMLIAMTVSYIMPIAKVFALDDTYNVVVTLDVADSSDVTLIARGPSGNLAVGQNGDGLVAHRGDGEYIIDFIDTYNNSRYGNSSLVVNCTSNKKCSITVTVPNEHGVMIQVGGDTPIAFKKGDKDYNGENLTSNTTLVVVNNDSVGNHPNDPSNPGFDGKAYLIWSSKNGGTCYHYFDNIPVTLEGGVFYKTSDIRDDNTNEVFDVKAEIKGFALKSQFDKWVTGYKNYKEIDSIDWSKVDTNEIVGVTDMRQYEEAAIEAGVCKRETMAQGDFEKCVDNYVEEQGIFTLHANLQPVGEPYSENAYVSYGDRNFKVIIYNDNYRGVTIGSLDDLSYYPAIWNNPFLRVESYDISETTKDTPVDIETILLEPIVNIKALDEYNSFEIKSIEPLDVPSDAVTVTKVDDEFKIKFSSNFYDNVVFKVTSTDDEVYYIRINRITLDSSLRFIDNKPVIESKFFFDRNTEYTDYIVTAKIVYKDGTYKNIEMVNAKEIDDGLGNKTYAYELDEETEGEGPSGKGLKVSVYRYALSQGEDREISKIYFNVEFKGSTSESYAGAFAGSGKGVVLSFEEE